MKFYLKIVFYCSFIVSLVVGDNGETSAREGKQIIGFRIPAKNCTSYITGYSEGYCDGIASCISYGGYFGGLCNSGLGMCCIVRKSCGESIQTRIAYFRNRGHPSSTTADGECEVTVHRYYSDVTQVRIDFIEFDLEGPSASGSCSEESFTVAGSDPRFTSPTICGENAGKHMYLNFANTASSQLTLKVSLSGSRSSKFNIKITQFRCNHPDKAPDGCLQYYRDPTGTIESFNYGTTNQQIQNQFYEACIDKNAVGACVAWTFSSINLSKRLAPTTDQCVADGTYLCIPGGKSYPVGGGAVGTDKLFYCTQSPDTVISSSYKIQVVLGQNAGTLTGFKADYQPSTLTC